MSDTALQLTAPPATPPALANALSAWAHTSTGRQALNRTVIIADKQRAVAAFFTATGLAPDAVTPLDVQAWLQAMEARGLSANTIYTRASRVSAFYRWLMSQPALAGHISFNPVQPVHPPAPKPYQSKSSKAFRAEEVAALWQAVQTEADAGKIAAKRDLALLALYYLSGMRRSEIIGLSGRDVVLPAEGGGLLLEARRKGGLYATQEVAHPLARATLLDYLTASNRLSVLETAHGLWGRHDRGGINRPLDRLTSHSFARNLKRYAALAGVAEARIHRLRHTFAQVVADASGSLQETQEALGHAHAATTRVYVQRIGIKKDKFGAALGERLNFHKK